jgi:hypothetical protein
VCLEDRCELGLARGPGGSGVAGHYAHMLPYLRALLAESGTQVGDGRDVDGVPEFHGHPASRIDRGALKLLRDVGQITPTEYNRLRKELPGC